MCSPHHDNIEDEKEQIQVKMINESHTYEASIMLAWDSYWIEATTPCHQ